MPGRTQSGIALVAVLWMVSALAVLAAGLAHSTRVELRTAQQAVAEARATALGDAAVQLAMLELRAGALPPDRLQLRRYRFDGQEVWARITPATGLVNLNGAGEELLFDLFRFGAGLAEEEARSMAQRVLDWRDPAGGHRPQGAAAADYEAAGSPVRPRGAPFEVVEDLRQVLGMTPDLYHVLRPHVTIHGRGSGVAPLAAPVGVLALLAGGDREEAARLDRLRAAGEVTPDLTGLRQAHLGAGRGAIFRIEGIMPAGGARHFVRTWWVDLEANSPSGLPWRTLAREAARAAHPQPLEDEG